MDESRPTYHGSDFRTYPIQREKKNGRWYAFQVCEELDPESGRWEPFISIVGDVA